MKWTRSVLTLAILCVAGSGPLAAQTPPAAIPQPSAKNPVEGNADAIRYGMGLFRSRCADCHGMDARGVRGPDITQVWASGRTDAGLFTTIRNGVPNTEMPANPRLSEREAWQLLAYLKTLAAPAPTDPPRGDAQHGETHLSRPVRRLPPSGWRRRPSGTGPLACRRRAGAGCDRASGSPRPGRLQSRIRTGHRHAGRRPADPRRQEERGSVLRPDHGYGRTDSGL